MRKKDIVAVFFLSLIFLFASCHKTCTCTGWIGGVEGKPYKIELDKDEKNCKDKSTLEEVDGVKVGIECK